MSRFKPTPSYTLFLDMLTQERLDRGVSIEELATRLELTPAQVQSFERGERQLDFVQTRHWCIALGVPFLDFMLRLDAAITAQSSDDQEPQGGAK